MYQEQDKEVSENLYLKDHTREVTGSSPVSPIHIFIIFNYLRFPS